LKPSALERGDEVDAPEAGGRVPFEEVYERYFAFVWRCLRGLGVPDASLDDAAQDVFVVVHRRLPAFRWQSTIRTWLFGIARNIASNHQRGVRRKDAGKSTLPGDLPSIGPDPLEQAQDAEAAAFVRRFLASLDRKKRDVFMLAVLEQMSVPEVAETLSIPLNTAYTRLRSARAEFQRALARRRGTP
jgi:RNA polymerase sigma-70 factor (ECF subfamily)